MTPSKFYVLHFLTVASLKTRKKLSPLKIGHLFSWKKLLNFLNCTNDMIGVQVQDDFNERKKNTKKEHRVVTLRNKNLKLQDSKLGNTCYFRLNQ